MMVRTKIFVKEDTKMLYTEKEKHEIERVKEVFAEHLRQSPDFELLWSDKVGYVWLTIGVNPVYVDTGIRIESAADLCGIEIARPSPLPPCLRLRALSTRKKRSKIWFTKITVFYFRTVRARGNWE